MMMRFMTMECMYNSGEMHDMYEFTCGGCGGEMHDKYELAMQIHVYDIELLADTSASYNMPSVCFWVNEHVMLLMDLIDI